MIRWRHSVFGKGQARQVPNTRYRHRATTA